jgi:predicted nucleotide-binding protein
MEYAQELFQLADKLQAMRDSEVLAANEAALVALDDAATEIGRSSSGSWLGYHANVYYAGLTPPPPGAHFSQEWGLRDNYGTSFGSTGKWQEWDRSEIVETVRTKAGSPDLTEISRAAADADQVFETASADIRSILLNADTDAKDQFIEKLVADLDKLQPMIAGDILNVWKPNAQVMTRDTTAVGQGFRSPPHLIVKAEVASIRQAFNICYEAGQIARRAASHLERKAGRIKRDGRIGTNVFLGHGRSAAWRELKDFVEGRLHLPWDEFNRVPVAGFTNIARLAEMLDAAAIAFLIMTGEDETAEGKLNARMNVVHEVGLFQGRLGFARAIIILEDGCEEFSNVQGLGQIRFPKGNIGAAFEEIRRVLEREKIIPEG